MRQAYLEDIAHKRENPKMDLWTFAGTEPARWLPCPKKHWFDTNTNGFSEES
jgi:hypothetical protein